LFGTVLGIGAMVTIGANGVLGPDGFPKLSRQQAIGFVLHSEHRGTQPTRIEARLMHRSDLEMAAGKGFEPGRLVVLASLDRIWLVAVSGDFGPECSQCSGPNTWGLAVLPDRNPGEMAMFIRGTTGDWPPFFDTLPDIDTVD
jgi:hypothetical protein